MKALIPLKVFAVLALTGCTLSVASPAETPAVAVGASGTDVGVFESAENNYRLDLTGAGYRYVNGAILFPEASFSALRLGPHVVSLVIAEELAVPLSAEQYAEAVQWSMEGRLEGNGSKGYRGHRDVGTRDTGAVRAAQKLIYAQLGNEQVTYALSAVVDGGMAYQLLSFSTTAKESDVLDEADRLLAGFSISNPAPVQKAAKAPPRSVHDYSSDTFGYRVRTPGKEWMDWPNVRQQAEAADFGALSLDGFGLMVLPVCWQGEPPTPNVLYRMAMQQFGEEYPNDFVTEERDVQKGGSSGRLFIGTDVIDGDEYLYYIAMLANADCGHLFSAWGLTSVEAVEQRLERLWADFEVLEPAAATNGTYAADGERARNAIMLNNLGMQLHTARSYRDAHQYFDQASALDPDDPAFIVNAVQTLAELSAFQEAADWLDSRIAPVARDQVVRSWDAWLAYQVGNNDKAARIYGELFAAGYRDDNDFTAYVRLLGDAGNWDAVQKEFRAYKKGGASFSLRVLEAELTGRRGDHEQALALLDELDSGRAFNPELAYARIKIQEEAGNPAEVLRLADELIANNYRSLQSWFYKGSAQYQLQSYRDARASFEEALRFAPGNGTVREYMEAIDAMLGEGDVSLISQRIEAVALPRQLAKVFASVEPSREHAGYGSEYLARMKGLAARGNGAMVTTYYQKIHVFDDNGVEFFSTLEFDFDASAEQLYVNSLRVFDPDGELIAEGELQSYFITSDKDGYEASTERTAHLPVPKLAPGMTIEAIVSKRTQVGSGTFPVETHFLATDRPIRESALFVAADTSGIEFLANGVDAPVADDGARVWHIREPVAYRWEPLLPYFDQILPWVQTGSVGASWQAVGDEYLADIADKLGAEGVADRAVRLVDAVEGTNRRIEILSAYVQDEITYKAIEFGRRAYVPKTARETLRDRYGDCKDHAVLLYTMLNAAGIDASLALVNLTQAVHPELPNTDQFNHMIVAVATESGPLFIDSTDKDLRLGSLAPRSLRGSHALVLGEVPELVRIPTYDTYAESGLRVERIVELADAATLAVRETARLSGYQAANLRGQLRAIESPDMQSSIQRWVAGRYPDAEVTDYFVENVFDANYDLVVEIRYELPVTEDGKFDLPGFVESYYLEYDRMADRRFPFEFYYPLRVSSRTSLRVPPGRALAEAHRRPETGESRFGIWRRAVTVNEETWEILFDYEAATDRFAAEEYRAFAEFQRDAIRGIEMPVVMQ